MYRSYRGATFIHAFCEGANALECSKLITNSMKAALEFVVCPLEALVTCGTN